MVYGYIAKRPTLSRAMKILIFSGIFLFLLNMDIQNFFRGSIEV